MAYILKLKELLASGKEIKPQITETNNANIRYYPIITNAICMQCHGELNEEILPETIAKKKRYTMMISLLDIKQMNQEVYG